MNRKIAFLFGAGAEGSGQLELPSGAVFKRDIIISNHVTELIHKVNLENESEKINYNRLSFLNHNNRSILYQTLVEKGVDLFNFSDQERITIENYIAYKTKDSPEGKNLDTERVKKEFSDIFRRHFYDNIQSCSDLDRDGLLNFLENNQDLKTFLENACFYSFVDSLFNYLRKPDFQLYSKEVAKIIKLYFSAFNSILSIDSNKDFLNGKSEVMATRAELSALIDEFHDRVINNFGSKESLYYNIVKEFKNVHANDKIFVVTTNYTDFAERIISLNDEDISYVHGRLCLFEDLKTKRVAKITDFKKDDFVFPFIFVQSGVKPVVSGLQIKELSKAVDAIIESDYLIVLGYGVNSDDEHITTLLRSRLLQNKSIDYFIYEKEDRFKKEKEVKNELCTETGINFYQSNELEQFLKKL